MIYAGGVVGKPLYATLNEKLRSGNPPLVWNTMSKLLTQGLGNLGLKSFPALYRSCHCPNVAKGTPFTFSQFASTSLDVDAALGFLAAEKSFIRIVNAIGSDITKYSSFPNESEVLLSPDVNLDVIQVETDINQIRKEIQKIAPGKSIPDTVKMYIVLDGSRKTKKPKGGFWSSCLCGLKPK